MALSLEPKKMCLYCFDVLEGSLSGRNSVKDPSFTNDAYPLFVTWKIGPELNLRGCIGTFSAIPLHDGVKEYALISSLNDNRFDPVTLDELPNLTCSVSLLVGFEDCLDCFDWTVGIHGIRIEFMNNGRVRSATYLPEVSSEQGWNQESTVLNLLYKGGYRKKVTQEFLSTIKTQRYRSEKLSINYQSWIDSQSL